MSPLLRPALKMLASTVFAGLVAAAGCTSVPQPPEGAPPVRAEVEPTAFEETVGEIRANIDGLRETGVDVPVPEDAGGGYTHEQHKQNGKTIYEAGMLYELTGEVAYLDFAASMLDQYADLYPTLGLHPKVNPDRPSRLFWQGLNEAVWLVYVSQGYAVIRDDLSTEQRAKFESQLIRPMADFLSEGAPHVFNMIHNHGTWAAAAVGLTGYALDDRDYVDKALYGLDKSGEAGFLRQIDLLFSPDGYYAEGPYYQRYALMPFVLFAQAIEKNDPALEIFDYRDGVLAKVISSTIQQTYGGRFFPVNDAIREKGLNTAELRYAVAIAYGLTGDGSLLSIAQQQNGVVPTPEGKALADAIAAGKSEQFPFRTLKLRDGPEGERGALVVLRAGSAEDDAAVVFKATSQGLGHGHFDRLALLYFDNGDEIIADYGAARFLNVEPKNGGRYLPENESWAKQTVAHNTLVVDQSSQFGADWRLGEEHSPRITAFDDADGAAFAAAKMDAAYPGVDYQRVVALVGRPSGGSYVIDVVRGRSDATHTYDLPMHFKGQLIESSLPFSYATDTLQPLGGQNGYQHLWKTAEAKDIAQGTLSDLSFLIDDQFYTMTFTSDQPLTSYLTRLGANDPNNNLRNEQAMILRASDEAATFLSVHERHGRYDNDEEVTVYNGSSVGGLEIRRVGEFEIYTVTPKAGGAINILFAADSDAEAQHSLSLNGQTATWRGPVGLHVVGNSGETTENKTTTSAGE